MRLAGGGVKGGQIIGRTDELGLTAEDDPVHIHDLQATVPLCLGVDHERVTYRMVGKTSGSLTIGGTVLRAVLA